MTTLKYQVLAILMLTQFLMNCDNREDKRYYRSGIVVTDTLILSERTTLYEGDFVQIVTGRCTEECTYIKTKDDSGGVYFQDIETLCWLKNDMTVRDLISGEWVTLNKDNWLIFETVEDSKRVVASDGRKFIVDRDDIFFDNKEFFDSIVDQK